MFVGVLQDDGTRLVPSEPEDGAADRPYSLVVVLTAARSGSTLLRFMLDSHPLIAAPPELSFGPTLLQIRQLWANLLGTDDLPMNAAHSIRGMFDNAFRIYLDHHGKRIFCEKSLGTAIAAASIREIFPDVRFLCLYRECRDVIASAHEALPWGINGYGLDSYIASSPGNSVFAIARYWLERTNEIRNAEKEFSDSCLRVRYEDLVTRPESVLKTVWEYLSVPDCPGLLDSFLTDSHEPGPSDHKIWYTRSISNHSIGRGTRVPLSAIPPALQKDINPILQELNYAPLGESLLVEDFANCDDDSNESLGVNALVTLMRTRLSPLEDLVTERGEHVRIVISDNGADVLAQTQMGVPTHALKDCDSTWAIIGDQATWRGLLNGDANLGVALRRGEIRYQVDGNVDQDITKGQARVAVFASALGLGSKVSIPG